ncbi:hypothetical protein K435DRAFT_838622 [Dendrothele bispora CBS 962.96]|uniref:Snurportin-1 n=1 Tax=Dendrothele bispora (strain CBS 962.96) TaxID=1314807 RepID=A0A4S8M5G4_DENBC|nr:hypothetical protein K435DRAFT_838622 [Dendrothele bispora CBS 962.96]
MASGRKTSFKLPPTVITDTSTSQRTRRERALEEQKRRRAERFDLTRQLDGFADLNIAESDEEDNESQKDPNSPHGTKVVHGGLASFTSLLGQQTSTTDASASVPPGSPESPQQQQPKKKKGKKRRVRDRKDQDKPNEWADKCMYAELLEMNEDDPFAMSADGSGSDGLPDDLETAWIAVAPVPVGKRCLAITRDSSGYNGVEPNTTLRSRLLGKPLLPWFPSTLPPNTVLDCILDENWRDTGVLHILDVLKWKGQDIADCETPFRFWWRDTRIRELSPISPPSQAGPSTQESYRFPYPTTLLPIPYHTDTSLQNLLSQIIPVARAARPLLLQIPFSLPGSSDTMQIETSPSSSHLPTGTRIPNLTLLPMAFEMLSDGLLLYVSEATYESGTSPLSSWIPLKNYDAAQAYNQHGIAEAMAPDEDTPMNKFERLVRLRMERELSSTSRETQDPSSSSTYTNMDTEMSN